VADAVGWGAAQQSVTVGRYATLPGGELDNIKNEPRRAVIAGPLKCSSASSVNDRRQELLSILSPSSVPRGKVGYQPVRLWYICADVVKEIAVHYESGLDMDIKPDDVAQERIAVRFVADDPNWYEIGTSSTIVNASNSDFFVSFYSRLRSVNTWSPVGAPAMTSGGSGIATRAIKHASDQKVYLGGEWINLNGNANADRIAYYDPDAQTYNAMGTGIGDGIVYAIAEGPDGTVYVAGTFSAAGGVANTQGLASWNGSAWASVGAAGDDADGFTGIYAMAFGHNGELYAVGDFEGLGGENGVDYIGRWDSSSWGVVGTPNALSTITAAYAVAVDSQGNVWVGGDFTDWGNGLTGNDYWAMYDSDDFSEWGTGTWTSPFALTDVVRALWVNPANDDVYVGGDFDDANSVSNADRIFRYDGTEARALSTGANGNVWSIQGAPDGTVYVGGVFTTLGGLSIPTQIGRWNGASFAYVDFQLSGTVYAIEIGQVDPTVERLYDVWVGDARAAVAQMFYAGGAIPYVTNQGTEAVYPKLKIAATADGGVLRTLRNETTGHELFFNYTLRSGETLTVDLDPKAKNISSDYFGKRLDAVLANSDMGQWRLIPGTNNVTCFISTVFPAATVWLEWRDPYNGLD
jgi:hypothetical protein